jgi:hypothetical protein
LAALEGDEIALAHQGDAERDRMEVVDEGELRDGEGARELLPVHDPAEVRDLGAAADDRAGHGETGGLDRTGNALQELAQQIVEGGVRAAVEAPRGRGRAIGLDAA